MSRVGDTLLQFISGHPSVVSMSIAEFAKRIKVGRASIYRWDSTMPTPEIVRRIADELGEPYAVVLEAALRSGGYITATSDMLAGLPVHVVNHGFNTYEEWPVPVVAYAEKEHAEKLVDDADMAYRGGYEYGTVVIAAAPPRPAKRCFARFERGANDIPHELAKCVVSHRAPIGPAGFPAIDDDELKVTGAVSEPFILMRNGYLMRVESDAFDEAAARLVVERTLKILLDRLPPVATDFATVEDLPPITDPLPAAIEIRDDLHGQPSWSIGINALLSADEISIAADAYRAAREVNDAAAAIIAAFEAQAQAAR